MDNDLLRYVMGAMVAAIVHLYFESRKCRSEHADCRSDMATVKTTAVNLSEEVKTLKAEIEWMKPIVERRDPATRAKENESESDRTDPLHAKEPATGPVGGGGLHGMRNISC